MSMADINVVTVYMEGGHSFQITEEGAQQIRAALPNQSLSSINVQRAAGGLLTLQLRKLVAIEIY